MVVDTRNPAGVRVDSAYLAIHHSDILLSPLWRPVFTIQGLYSAISLLHIFCQYCIAT
jgi:hypothetical protein